MTRDELFTKLELDIPEDFEYFEQFAELFECSEDIDFDDFYAALSKADPNVITEINENYFSEVMKYFPDDNEMLEVMNTAVDNLSLLLPDISDEAYRREYVQQLYDFHNMYISPAGCLIDGKPASVLESVTRNRLSRIDKTEHKYDYSASSGFTPDYLCMKLGGFEKNE